MKLTQYFVLVLAVLGICPIVQAQTVKPNLSKAFIQEQLDAAANQIKVLAAETFAEKFPKTFEQGEHVFSSSSWWCSGFYPGTLLYLYEGTKEKALLELSQYTKGSEALNYFEKAETILKNLSKAPYLAPYGQNGGYILQHSVGALPLNSEIDVPLTYADYYYVEALVRYQRLLAGEPMIKEIAK